MYLYSLTAIFSFSWSIWSDVKANSGVRLCTVDGSSSTTESDLDFLLKLGFAELLEGVLDLWLFADDALVLGFFSFGVVDPCRLLLLRPRVAERLPAISFSNTCVVWQIRFAGRKVRSVSTFFLARVHDKEAVDLCIPNQKNLFGAIVWKIQAGAGPATSGAHHCSNSTSSNLHEPLLLSTTIYYLPHNLFSSSPSSFYYYQ